MTAIARHRVQTAVRCEPTFARTAPLSPEGYWQPHPPPPVAAGPQHVDFSL
ncbi:hypothetical protein [Rhodococcus opacus]|uniref:hypothetical protein n=1 Tax=Rhodococcus opacus TaxID=37919 RepID=UPI002955B301|nr:hypothetical protein [Rhodococcus opacus]